MSVVACRVFENHIEIASDSITVIGYSQRKGENTTASKLVKINDMIIGSVGYCEEEAFFQTFAKTHMPKTADVESIIDFLVEFADWKKKKIDNAEIQNSNIIVYRNKAFITEGFLAEEIVNYEVTGAGANFAMAALHMNATVEEAVKVACELSIYCELPVKIIRHSFKEK